jgi:hypothetical protein
MFLQRSDDPSLLFRADDSIVCENNIRRLVLFVIANNSLGVVVAGHSTSKRVVAAVMAFYGYGSLLQLFDIPQNCRSNRRRCIIIYDDDFVRSGESH